MTGIDPDLARWITAPGSDPQNPLLRTHLTLGSPPTSARLLVTGLGVFRSFVNGTPAPRSRLDPGLTDARTRVPVCEVEVTELLAPGQNVLAIALGRGFHAMDTPNEWRWDRAPWRGPVRAWAHLEVTCADASTVIVATGEGWRTRPGPVTFDSMYEGETFAPTEDPRAWLLPGYEDAHWQQAILATDVGAPRLEPQRQEPVVIAEEITPQVVSRSADRVVLDMGRVIAGWCRYELAENLDPLAGPVAVVARHGEKLREGGTVDDENIHIWTDRFQQDRVRLDPAFARSFEPQYSYKGFRYVQLEAVTGSLADVEVTGVLAHADLTPASTLTSSDRYLEQFDAAMRASLRNNLHHVPTDTPMHEKNGWTGDALTALPAMTAGFDMRSMLHKWLLDQVDGQRADGSLSVISPNPGWGYEELSPAPEWTTLLPVLIDELATEYGRTELVAEHGGAAAAYLRYELSRRDDEGLTSSVLGDYLSPGTEGPAREDKRLTGTLFVARALRALAHAIELAGVAAANGAAAANGMASPGGEAAPGAGLPAPRRLRAEAGELEAAVNAVFLDRERGLYVAGTGHEYRQTSNALALACGIVPGDLVDHVVANLVADIEERGDHHDCGHIGVRFLLPVLSQHGHGELAMRVLANPTAPGWRAWLEAGNSTFMEMWHQPRSCSHYFMGTPATWIHEHAAGLRRGPDGWREFVVGPDPDVPVGRIGMTRETVHGRITVRVDRTSRVLEAEVPAGTQARVQLPGRDSLLEAGSHTVRW